MKQQKPRERKGAKLLQPLTNDDAPSAPVRVHAVASNKLSHQRQSVVLYSRTALGPRHWSVVSFSLRLIICFSPFSARIKTALFTGLRRRFSQPMNTIDKTIDESAIATASVGGDEEPRRLEIRGRVPSSDWRGKLKTWNFTSLTLGSSPTDFPSSPSLYLSTAN